ncbi:MAG: RNA polymerase sigma factor, partial [Saprospiraceae bacterium]
MQRQKLPMRDELITRLQAGDPQAVGQLYDRYARSLFGVVLRIVGDREMAENVLQDVFVKAWKSAASFDPDKSGIFTWLNRIARNAAIDATRSAQFKQRRKTGDAESLVY